MALPMAAWRLSYRGGSWLALSGPTSLVILPKPAAASPLVADLWQRTLTAHGLEGLFEFLCDAGIDAMPHFGAFFWDAKGLHGLTRGDVRLTDEQGTVWLEGRGSMTWREKQLDTEQTYVLDLEPVSDDAPVLPLVVGAALVSRVTLTTAQDQLLRFPSADSTGILTKVPLLGVHPDQRAKADQLQLVSDALIQTPMMEEPSSEGILEQQLVADVIDELVAVPPPPDTELQVLAVPCQQGHANPPGARSCRLCSALVDSSNPRLIRRPTLAGVNTNQGDFQDLTSTIVVGRAPDPSQVPNGAHPMRVPSPGNDISRNHLLISTRDWNVIVTDLHSTNGTLVRPVGEPEFELRDGRSVQVEFGTILDLGDGTSLRIEPPRSS